MTQKYNIYLDDVRTPTANEWVVVRNYDEFVAKINELGFDNIEHISLDHDLGETAMAEYYNGIKNYTLDYNNIKEKTGMDCTKWLVDEFYNLHPEYLEMGRADKKRTTPYFPFPKVYVHSANPIGSANMMGYINNFLKNEAQPEDCVRVRIEHTVEPNQYGM
jgi:hypothetical protein